MTLHLNDFQRSDTGDSLIGLLRAFVEKITTEMKEAIFDFIREIQGQLRSGHRNY